VSAVFKKLNLRDQAEVVVLDAPATFEPEIAKLSGVTVRRALTSGAPVSFALAFVTRQGELDALATAITKRAMGDPVVWFAYPKQSSKSVKCEFNRDTGWGILGRAGLEPVRMVAIDADWSAVRFRRVEHIKTMTRDPSYALSSGGKKKAGATAGTRAKRKAAGR
jgi:hypothetical protein